MPAAKMWQLELGGEVIAVIRQAGYETPWTYGEMLDTTKFEPYRVYFGDDTNWPDTQEFEDFLGTIHDQGKFRLREVATGAVHREFTFNHDGNDGVWFRY